MHIKSTLPKPLELIHKLKLTKEPSSHQAEQTKIKKTHKIEKEELRYNKQLSNRADEVLHFKVSTIKTALSRKANGVNEQKTVL